MKGGGWGIPRNSSYLVGGSKKRRSYQMKGGWGEEEVRPQTKNKDRRNSSKSFSELEENQLGGGWGGARTIRYDINSGSSSVVNKYFKKYFR